MKWYGFAGPLTLVVLFWALAVLGPVERREYFLVMAQGATIGTLVLFALGLLAAWLHKEREHSNRGP